MHRPPPQLCSGYARAQSLLLAALLCLGFPGCASSRNYGPPGPRTVTADWNDIKPAVEAGAKRAEMAVLRADRPEPGLIIYYLRTATDEPATLEVRASNPALQTPQPLTLTPKVGRFGNPRLEARLAASVERRLQQLAGVEHAPLNN